MSEYGEMALRDQSLNTVGSVKVDAALQTMSISRLNQESINSLLIHVCLLFSFLLYLSGFLLYK